MFRQIHGLEFRDLASWPVFWVTLVGNALLPGLLTSQVTGLTLGNRLVLMALTQAIVWAVILGVRSLSGRYHLGFRSVIVTAVMAAVLRGLALSELFPLLGIGTSGSVILRVLMSTTAMGFLILASTAAVASSRRYHVECDRLSSTHERLLKAREEAIHLSEIEEDRFSEQVSQLLRTEVAGMAGLDRFEAAQRVRAISDELVRPLAHSLVRSLHSTSEVDPVQQAPVSVQPPSFRDVLLVTLHPAYIRPLLVALACSILPLPGSLTRFGVVQGFVICGVVFLSILVSGLAARFTLRSLARPGTVLGILMLALAIGLITLFTGLIFTLVTDTTFVTAALAVGAVITLVTLIIAIGHAFTERRELILRQLVDANDELTWQIARTNGVRWSRQRTMARALHGPIQSALISAALGLEDESRQDVSAEKLTQRTVEWLDSTIEEWASQSEQNKTLEEQIALVKDTWSGQCYADFHWEDISAEQIDEDPICATILADLVIEGFSNAVRHGRARNLQVTIKRAGSNCIGLHVHDDGRERRANPAAGIGMAYLDEVTTLHAFTQESDGGSIVAQIPFTPTRTDFETRG